jgi:hypothetical protein
VLSVSVNRINDENIDHNNPLNVLSEAE